MEDSLTGKSAIVTGAGRGIGRAIVKRLHDLGVTVYAISKNPQNLESLKNECPNVQTVAVDLGDWDATRSEIQKLPATDYLVNNAAILNSSFFQSMKPEDLDQMYNVSLKGVVNVSQIFVQQLVAEGRPGSIVNVASTAGLSASPMVCGYSTLKAGLVHLTKNMAVELGPLKIRANVICPGLVDTDMLNNLVDEAQTMGIPLEEWFNNRTPSVNKKTDVNEVVNTVLFLLSNCATNITGAVIPIDGGFTAA